MIHTYLKKEGLQFSKKALENYLVGSPEYPSIKSYSKAIHRLGIPNDPIQVEMEQLDEMPKPIFAFSKKKNPFIIISGDQNNYLVHKISKKKPMPLAKEELSKLWGGTILLFDRDGLKAKHEGFDAHISKKVRIYIALSLLLVMLIVLLKETGSLLLFKILILKSIGVFVGALLIKKELLKETYYRFCSLGTKVDCESVLESKGAQLLSWFSLSDAVLLYFSGTFLITLFAWVVENPIQQEVILSLVALNTISLPVTIYSILYQGLVIKKWCTLCLVTSALLWLEFSIDFGLLGKLFSLDFSIGVLSSIFLFLIVLFLVWGHLKDFLFKILNYRTVVLELSRFKNSFAVFESFLKKEKSIDVEFVDDEIVLGNENSENTLVVVMNPFCKLCGEEFNTVLHLLEKYPDHTKIVLRFLEWPSNDNEQYIISKELIGIYHFNRKAFIEKLQEWFETKNHKDILTAEKVVNDGIIDKTTSHTNQWLAKNGIRNTPTLIFNNHFFPRDYSLNDFIEILDFD